MPTNFPDVSVSSTPKLCKASIVPLLCILVKIVLRPVAIVSADSRVVDLTAVNMAENCCRASIGSVICPADTAKTPPARRMAATRSEDSTANFLETLLRDPSTCSD